MLIVVDLVLAQDPPQMGLVPDEGAVQELAAASPDPPFGNRVHPGRPHVAQHGPDAEVHDQVTGLLRGPFPGWMQSDAGYADAPGCVLYHGQDAGLDAVEQVNGEEVASQDRVGLRAQELRPGWPRPPAARGRCR